MYPSEPRRPWALTFKLMEKLDNYSKILVATSAINYMANQIDTINCQMKMMDLDKDSVLYKSIEQKDEALRLTVGSLGEIMENLGDMINNQDMAVAIDLKIVEAAFGIIIHGKDNVEGEG